MQLNRGGLLALLHGEKDGEVEEKDPVGSVLHLGPPDQGTDSRQATHENAEAKVVRPRRARRLLGAIRSHLIGPRSDSAH